MAVTWKLNGVSVETLGLDNLRLNFVNQQPDSLSVDDARHGFEGFGDYTAPPTVALSGGGGTGAAGMASIGAGMVAALTLTAAGSGYTSAPSVAITGGGGAGATGTATLAATDVATVAVTAGGSGFTSAPTITLSGGGGTGATATGAISGTGVATIAVTAPGSGYTSAPAITITGGGGSGCTATANISAGVVTGITVTAPGSGYTSAPTIALTGGAGSGATASATLTPSTVASVTVTNGGSGYTTAPTVVISGGGGTGATATATLSARGVGSVTVTVRGSGYTSDPTVSFTGGGGTGAAATVSRVGSEAYQVVATNQGAGYTSAPTVTVTGGGGTGAIVVASIISGGVHVTLTAAGSGYTSRPSLVFSGGGGTGAAAFLQMRGQGIASIAVTNGGSGYATPPTVVITPGTGEYAGAATATATVSGGAVTAVNVTAAGDQFESVPTISFTGGGGTGATATATLLQGRIQSIAVTSAGSGYTSTPDVSLSGGGGTGAEAQAVMGSTSVASVAVTAAGSGYTGAPGVALSGGGGTGATATAALTATTIASIAVTAQGSGYTSAPAVGISGGGGTGATATSAIATIVDSVTVTAAGSGYTSAPGVSFSGGGGTGAAAAATITPSALGSITVTNGGSGYTSAPTVAITGGGGTGATGAAALSPTEVATLNLVTTGGGFALDTAITLTRTEGAGDPVTWFVGVVRETPRFGRANDERATYNALGPWQWLERIPYVQTIAVATTPSSSSSGLTTALSGRSVLGQSSAGAKVSLGAALNEVLDYAIAEEPGTMQRADFSGITLTIPWDEVVDLSCAEVVSRLLQFIPDAVCWWDYTQSPPMLNITRRSVMTSLDLPILKPGTDIGDDFEQAVRGGFDLRSRPDLQKAAVVLVYQSLNRANEAQWLAQTVDKYPTGAATVDANGNLTALDDAANTLVRTIQLAGSVWQGTILEQPVEIDPFPSALVFSGAVTSGGTFDSAKAWWLEHASELKKSNVTIVKLVDGTRTAADGSAVTSTCSKELIRGAVTQWMEDDAGIEQEAQLVKVTVHIDVGVVSAGKKERQVLDISVPVIGTNAATKTYTSLESASYTAAEDVPNGLAQAIYDAISTLHYEGAVELVEREPTVAQLVGRTLNLTGGLVEWETMAALIQRATVDVTSGTTEITIGPPRQLGPDDLVELYRVNRNRLPVTSSLMRTSGKGGTEGQRKSLAVIVPRTPVAGAALINPRKITKSISVAGVVPTVSEVQTALQASWDTGDHPIAGDEIVLTLSSVPKLAYHVTLQNIGTSGINVVSFTVNSLTYYAYLTQIGIF